MKNNFWENLKKPFFAMAPMAGITDSSFRQMCVRFGADVVYSEMASATALVYAPEKTLEILQFEKKERPYVVQLFGAEPKHFVEATKIITKEIKPNGIDINFGCPVKKVQKQGAGAVLMKDFKKSRAIIENVINNTDLPVSIKTRTRVDNKSILDFLEFIKDLDIKALMIHGRTLAQGFSGAIDTETIKKARDFFSGVLMANGGVYLRAGGEKILQAKEEKFKIVLEHVKLAEKHKGQQGVIEMRKHLCWYAKGFEGASELRRELIQVETIRDIKKILKY